MAPKILVAPGSGDIHWVMLKMEGFIQKHLDGVTPEIWVWSENQSKDRAQGYIERLPFVKWGGYFRAEKFKADGIATFVHGKPHIRQNYRGFDWFMAFNQPLEAGLSMDEILPKVATNWDYEIRLTQEDLDYGLNMRDKAVGAGYIVCAFFGHGFYGKWLQTFGIAKIKDLLKRIVGRTFYTPVLIGRGWDRSFMDQIWVPGCFDHVGRTSMGQMLGLCSKARAFVGFAAGNGMLAQHLGTPTYMIWGEHFRSPEFMTNWVAPHRRQTAYKSLHIAANDIGIADFIVKDILHEDSLPSDRSGAQREPSDDGDPSIIGDLGETE